MKKSPPRDPSPPTPPVRRIVEVGKAVLRPLSLRRHEAEGAAKKRRRVDDYPHLSKAHRELAKKLSSPLMMGPPVCDELMDFVTHVFTEEEAWVARKLSLLPEQNAASVARKLRSPVEHIAPILKHLGEVKHVIYADGPKDDRLYRLVPVMPGIFEMSLISKSPETLTPWHKELIRRFEVLYQTHYAQAYLAYRTELVRFIPATKAVAANPAALPSDRLEAILDRYDHFAVGHCQCRMTMREMGEGCDRPLENCSSMGEWAESSVEKGLMRPVSKNDFREIKLEAEASGLATWILNAESVEGQASCSCCGCCCHFMQSISAANTPAAAAPPHFTPRIDTQKCVGCGACVDACPMEALSVDSLTGEVKPLLHRCVGCGVCAVSCRVSGALTMEPVPHYRRPPNSWYALLTKLAPSAMANALSAWLGR